MSFTPVPPKGSVCEVTGYDLRTLSDIEISGYDLGSSFRLFRVNGVLGYDADALLNGLNLLARSAAEEDAMRHEPHLSNPDDDPFLALPLADIHSLFREGRHGGIR